MVSIIIPFKNPMPFFEDCLKSIMNQTYEKLQIILINDSSTDQSLKLVEKIMIKDSRIEVYENKGNGIIDALNTGSELSKGKFITRMDADDIMNLEKIEILRDLLIKNGKEHIATGCVSYFSSNKKMGEGYLKYEKWLNGLTVKSENFKEIYKECTIPSPCWMMYSEDFNKINGFNNLNYPEDYDFAFRTYYNKLKVISSKNKLHFWRDHPNRTSRNSSVYEYENFIPLKINYLIKYEIKNKEKLILWGAGKKGKKIAKYLLKTSIPFLWISNNAKKIGQHIYTKEILSQETIDLEIKKLIICAISEKIFELPINTKFNRFINFF
jgi:glycosyltransferase involved in cell wall biosynthesis